MNILCIGDAGIDQYINPPQKKFGGCSLNVASHLSHFCPPKNIDISLLSPIGNDDHGSEINHFVNSFNIKNHLITVIGKTAVQKIKILKKGEKKFVEYCPGVLEGFQIPKNHSLLTKKTDLIVTVFFKEIESLFYSLIDQNLSTPIFCDFLNLNDYRNDLAKIEKIIPHIEIGLFGLYVTDTKLIHQIIQWSKDFNKKFLVTLGKNGVLLVYPDKVYFQKAPDVSNVIDTTGAGDAFFAYFIAHFFDLQNNHPKTLLAKCCDYGSKQVTLFGGCALNQHRA